MELEISKFVPAEMRIQMARELIEEKGIRPLARKIEVNPKTVYKYKEGSAHPKDDTMARIMAVMRDEDPDLFERFLNRLWDGFSSALDSSRASRVAEKKKSEKSKPKKVGQQPTKKRISLTEICDRVDITNPFERTKLGKILSVVLEEPGLTSEEIARRSGLSPSAVERYAEMLKEDGIFREGAPDVCGLTRPIQLEG
ncbi:hypothetical protein AKJ45_01670 [candidate division MSBL1 archaeon SCGC-AAA261F19]|uniref:Uncharacterized protein n=1 Tax=candidate division MSBL1 archaeon SCGC-AAA261F19 TaxID=1698275 RepID=A0A133VAJ0_9EURY|nr:hypothetical protein AKJ45_01670 [candidate division MSBL1 archaeon SCGC-AAA261F19]